MTVVRYARSPDTPGILDCLRAAFEPFRNEYTRPGFTDTVLTPDLLGARMTEMSVFVAEEPGEGVVGTIAAAALDDGEGHLRGMAVVPSRQGSGIARRLLRRAMDELRVAGCTRVTLDTTVPLVRAARFYESNGFARTGRVGDFFGMPLHEYARPIDGDVTVRVAGYDDIPGLLRLINAAYLVAEGFFWEGDRLNESELRIHFSRGTFLLAGRAGEPPLACVFLQPKPDRRVYLGLLAVDPSLQRSGLGGLMMAAAERRCHRDGCAAIDIYVVNLRTELPPFYESRGFLPDGTAPFEDPRRLLPAHFVRMTLPLV